MNYGLPLYQCHKKVRAARIEKIVHLANGNFEIRVSMTTAEVPAETGLEPIDHIIVDSLWMNRNPKCEPGGYFVQHTDKDNYTAYSPKEPFEDGYTLIPEGLEDHQQRVIVEKRELDEKVKKLIAFCQSPTYKTLPTEEQSRLSIQAHAMLIYTETLEWRIANF